jgi:hypothetical protein
LPDWLPVFLTSPLLQEGNRIRLIRRELEIEGLRIVIDELPLRSKLSQNGQEIVPVSFMTPRLETRIFDFGIKNGSDVDEGNVLDVNKECLVAEC